MNEENVGKNIEAEEDLLPKEYEDVLRKILELQREKDRKPSVMNPVMVKKFISSEQIIKDMFKYQDVKVSKEMFSPSPCMASIKAEGATLDIENMNGLRAVIDTAECFDIYPQRDGTVSLEFTFYDMTVCLDDEVK